jgi:hypothetical protein
MRFERFTLLATFPGGKPEVMERIRSVGITSGW